MIIIKLSGGLGNQMFQYALYLKYQYLGRKVYLDDEIITNKLNDNQALKIFDVFALNYNICDKRISHVMADEDISLFHRLRRRVFGKKQKDTEFSEDDLDNNYHPEILRFTDRYLNGCWQCEKYFEDIRAEVLNSFEFKIEDPHIFDIEKKIKDTNSVSVHVRRGDYLTISGYDGICTKEYYKKAIEFVKNRVDNPVFYVFSDDKDYAEEEFKNENAIIVHGFEGKTAHYDMYLMTICKHNIVANSSFSWWGAWLNNNENKIVVCPNKWHMEFGLKYTPCESWIKM